METLPDKAACDGEEVVLVLVIEPMARSGH
jgi:hypothetical protein